MDKVIYCKNCGKPVDVGEAMRHQFSEDIRKEEEKKAQKKFEQQKSEAISIAKKEYEEKLENNNKESLKKAEEEKNKREDLEVKLAKIEKDEKAREIKIREEEQKKAENDQHLKILEKDRQLQQALKASMEMSTKVKALESKLQQGSQQTQGDVLEEELENQLKKAFPNDKITGVVTGKRGGDIVQEVWDSKGNYNGKILWEIKNTKPPWKEDWSTKLLSDRRNENADDAILVSEIFPKDITDQAGYRNGIWVIKRQVIIPVAMGIRAKIIHSNYIRNSAKGKDEKIERLYNYLSGNEFKHRMEAIIEAYSKMQLGIDAEKSYFSRKWAKDEKNLRQLIDNTYGMRGDLEGIGANMLEIKEPSELTDGINEKEQEALL